MTDGIAPPRMRTDAVETVFHVAVISLRRALRGKRILWVLLMVLLPAALSLLIAHVADGGDQEDYFYSALVLYHFGIAVPATALILATAFPWPECDEGTLTYWFTAPVSRWAVHLGRLIAAYVLGSVTRPLCVLAIGLPLDPEHAHGESIRAAVTATLLAYPAYVAVFSVLTTITRRGLVIGVVGILIENSLSFFQGTIQQLTVVHYVRVLLWPSSSRRGRRVLDEAFGISEASPTWEAIVVMASVTVVGLLATLLLVSVTEFRGRHGQAE